MKANAYQQQLLLTCNLSPETEITQKISVGLLQHGGYFSQIFQGGHNYIHCVDDQYYHIETVRHLPVEQTGYGLIANADIVINVDTGDVSNMMIQPLINQGNVITLTRYPKNVQQWLIGQAAAKHGIHHAALSVSSPYKFKQLSTFSSYHIHSPNILNPLDSKKWWVLKPDNDAMSNNIIYLDGARANLMTILNLFRGTCNDISYKEAMEVIVSLQNQDIIRLKPNSSNKDYNFKKYYGGHIVAQERIFNFKEFRLIKNVNGKVYILERDHIKGVELPANQDMHFTNILGVWTPEHGFVASTDEYHDFFKSEEFNNFMRVFLEQLGFSFLTGSIDLFITKDNEYGVFEYQPQFGTTDVPLEVMEDYRQAFFNYILNHYTRSINECV